MIRKKQLCGKLVAAAIVFGMISPAAAADEAVSAAVDADEIRERGVLRVGTAGDYQPMSYLDPFTGDYVGFDAELAGDLAADLGV